MCLLECRKTSRYFPIWKKNAWLLLGSAVCEIKLRLEVQVSFGSTSIFWLFLHTNVPLGKTQLCPGFYTTEKVPLVLCTSRVQQNPTWNTAVTCSIPPPLLHHCLLSPFLRQTNCANLVCENLWQWNQAAKKIGFGGMAFQVTSVYRKACSISKYTPFLF